MRTFLIFLCIGWAPATIHAQDAQIKLVEGNNKYKQAQYEQAEVAYNESLKSSPSRLDTRFNRANAYIRQNKNDEAIKELDDIAFKSNDASLKSQAYYNKGVILSAQQKLEESIEAYKLALRYNSKDQQARENLQKAIEEWRKKKQTQPKPDPSKQQPKKQPQPKMNPNDARQRLKLLEQKEKMVKDRLQKQKQKTGGQPNDW